MIVGNTARDTARLFRHFFAAYPVRSTLMLLAITAAALAEGVGIAALLPMIGLVIDSQGTGGALAGYVEQVFAFAGQDVSLGGLLVLIVAAMALKALLMLLAMTQVGYSAAHAAMDMRLAFIRAILRGALAALRGPSARANWPAPSAWSRHAQPKPTWGACHVLSGALQILIYLGGLHGDILGGLAARPCRRCLRHGRSESPGHHEPAGGGKTRPSSRNPS